MHFSRNKKRNFIKDDELCRQNLTDLGEFSHLQVLLLRELIKRLLHSLHGTAGKQSGISELMQEIREVKISFNCNKIRKLGSRV